MPWHCINILGERKTFNRIFSIDFLRRSIMSLVCVTMKWALTRRAYRLTVFLPVSVHRSIGFSFFTTCIVGYLESISMNEIENPRKSLSRVYKYIIQIRDTQKEHWRDQKFLQVLWSWPKCPKNEDRVWNCGSPEVLMHTRTLQYQWWRC